MNDLRNSVATILDQVIVQLRTGDYGAAASGFNRALAAIQAVLRSETISPELMGKLQYSIETMLLMLEQEDRVGLADVIEYEFLPLWKRP